MGGSTKVKSTTVIPEPTEQEKEAQEISNLVNRLNLEQQGFRLTGEPGSLSLEPRELTAEEIEQQEFDKQLQAALREQLLGQPSEATQQRVGEVFQSQRERGERDLTRFGTELAASRGLNVTDTPIARELFTARGDLESGLRGAEASSLLNVGQANRLFAQSLRDFQEGLRQRAFLNRAGIAESFSQTALGLGRQRLAQPTTTQTSSGGGLFGGLGGPLLQGGLGAVGSIGAGFLTAGPGSVAAGLFGSSREFKDDIVELEKKDYKEVLEEIDETPLFRWKYKPEFGDPKEHLGVVTEEAPKQMVSEDGKKVLFIDALGMTMSAIKGLNEKVKELEGRVLFKDAAQS